MDEARVQRDGSDHRRELGSSAHDGPPATQRLVEQVLAEAIAVGRAEGARLPDSLAVQIMQALEVSTSTAPNSMHADRLAGRRMEIEARNGAIVRIGARHGVPTPVNALLVDLLFSVDHG